MKFLKPTVNRFVTVSVALFLQVAVILSVIGYFRNLSTEINTVIHVLSIITALFIINEKSNPAIKMAWVVFILVMPVFGCVLYFLMGGKRTRHWLRRVTSVSERKNSVYKKRGDESDKLKNENPHLYVQSKYVENMGFPLRPSGEVKYFPLGDLMFPEMIKELKKAKKFIFFEYFILSEGRMLGEIVDILEEKAKEGVDVRVIYDDMGSLFSIPLRYKNELERKGIKCIAFNPFIPVISAAINNRDHRKILVIDSKVAFTGGINIADEYINEVEKFGHWKDNGVMIKGSGAKDFAIMFLDLWNAFCDKEENIEKFLPQSAADGAEQGYIQPFYDTPLDDEKLSENIYLNAINSAEDHIYIYTPYLIPDYEMNSALCLAAKKGVDVKLIVPGIPDKKVVYSMTKSYYRTLIDAGVEIYKYKKGFVHAKGFVCDDILCCIGTVNLDFRSMCHHFECGCLFYNSPVVSDMKADMTETLKECEKVVEYQKFKGFLGSTYHAVLRLIAPLM